MTIENRIDITGGPSHQLTALYRLAYVELLAQDRLVEVEEYRQARGDDEAPPYMHRPAYEVHVHGDIAGLVADRPCRDLLEFIVRHGLDCHIVVFLHGVLVRITSALSLHSRQLAAALMAGVRLRYIETRRPPSWLAGPVTPDDAEHYTETLSAEVWACLVLDDADSLVRLFAQLRHAGDAAGSVTERRLLADALRRAADTILPGAGGMLHGGIPCPLCLAGPIIPVDEMPSHLVAMHAALAEGVRA